MFTESTDSTSESLLKARPDSAQPKCDCCQPAPWTSVDRLGPLGMAGNGGTGPADPKFSKIPPGQAAAPFFIWISPVALLLVAWAHSARDTKGTRQTIEINRMQ